jgi:transposase
MATIGVDAHKSSLAASAIDEHGREIAAITVDNDPAGHRAFRRWAGGLAGEMRVGIEGGGSFGATFGRDLVRRGMTVVEVPARLTARERTHLVQPGKSDPADALAIARIAAREPRLGPIAPTGVPEELRLLTHERDAIVVERGRLTSRLHARLVVLAPGYERDIPDLRSAGHLARATGLLARRRGVDARLARLLIRRIRELDRMADGLEVEIAARVGSPNLRRIHGVGPIVAAMLVGQVGDVLAFRSAAGFAATTGTAPIPASSGQTQRHRLNRGGNRQLNRALHIIALTQSRSSPAARAYLARKRAEGKSWREAMRCLKRQLADVVYRAMVQDALLGEGT